MIDVERRNKILQLLEDYHSVKVSDLSRTLFIGEATIRRDLSKLEQGGYLRRIHGGAVSLDQVDREIPADIRKVENAEKKVIIADLAAALIQSGNTISVDSSTTCLALASNLKKIPNLSVLTHSHILLDELRYSNLNLYASGGLLTRHTLSYNGEVARRFFASFYADLAFVSCKGLSIDAGPSWVYDEEAALREIMLQNARKRVMLVDSSKFGIRATSQLFNFSLVDYLITDCRPGNEWIAFFERSHVTLLYPKE